MKEKSSLGGERSHTLSKMCRGSSSGKESACNVGDPGSIPGSGRSPEVGNGNRFQYSCLENPMDREAWRAIVHGVAKESDMTEHTHRHIEQTCEHGLGVMDDLKQ